MNEESKVKKKRPGKRNGIVLLPGSGTVLYQSNRVTNGRFSFTLYQWKILAATMKALQEPIKLSMYGIDYKQLTLFNEDSKIIRVPIPLNEITTPNHYKDVVTAAKRLQDYKLSLKNKDLTGYQDTIVFFSKVTAPEKANIDNRSVTAIYVEMYKEVAEYLINMEQNDQGSPIKYTRYLYEVIIAAKSIYSPILYQKIASWSKKGEFVITLDELRLDLGLDSETYSNYSDFKKRILLPVQKELMAHADIWYNCNAKDFTISQGKKVVRLRFKITKRLNPEAVKIQQEAIKELLTHHFKLMPDHMATINKLFKAENLDYNKLKERILEIFNFMVEKGSKITNPQAYVVSSIINDFETGVYTHGIA
ncbi:replication initiator protein [Chitinophaga skermanii]|uniref:Replication initiator protein n=1 Tax=Chitinophaga skermanii TaxID=331697 RepID=A0A327PZ29_9BACT|nr:replication initiation protein [Chitinophaga skermanii]RAI96993.1 replication initiator protein [Chitinophaga skermanii]